MGVGYSDSSPTSHALLGKSLDLPVPEFPHLYNGMTLSVQEESWESWQRARGGGVCPPALLQESNEGRAGQAALQTVKGREKERANIYWVATACFVCLSSP